MTNIFDGTAERLQGYYPFRQEVTESVAYVASVQARHNYYEFLEHLGIPEPKVETNCGSKPIQVRHYMFMLSEDALDIDVVI